MPPAPKHRQPIIDAAVTLFRRNGYSATGLNDIVELSGAPKGSLYHYFPHGKSSIAAAAVDEAGSRVLETLTELSSNVSSTAELVSAHAKLLGQWMRKSGYKDGCPMTTVLLELAPEDRPVAQAAKAAYAARKNLIQIRLIEDGFSEKLATELASLCTSALQGALIETRIQKNTAPLTTAAECLTNLLSLHTKQ